MADRNEIFRIILEGRDRLSGQLDNVRRNVDKLDESLSRLKRNKVDEFPLFGGGSATRGPGGQFIKAEEISRLDAARRKVSELDRAIKSLRQSRIKEGEFALFGGGRAVKGDDGRFIRVQDVSLLDKAKSRIDSIDRALTRIRTRARRGPLVEGEIPGFGDTRLVQGRAGQFVRAPDLTLLQRFGRELRVVQGTIKDVQLSAKRGIIIDAENMFRSAANGANRLDAALGRLLSKFRRGTFPGFGGTTVRRGPGGQFVTAQDISLLNLAQRGIEKLQTAIFKLRRGRLREGEVFGFGGTRLRQNELGQFVKVEDISRIDSAKRKLGELTRALNIFNREKRADNISPLFGGGTASRGPGGQFQRDVSTAEKLNKAIREGVGGFRQGLAIAEQTRKHIEEEVASTKEIYKQRKLALQIEEDEARVTLTARQQAERLVLNKEMFDLSQVDKANKRFIRDNAKLEFGELSKKKQQRIIDILETTKFEKGQREKLFNDILYGDKKRKQAAISDIIDVINFEKSVRERAAQQEFTSRFQGERSAITRVFTQKRLDLERPDVGLIQENELRIRKEALQADTALGRMSKRAGLAFGDIVRGARAARSGMSSMDRDTNLVKNSFTRFGYAVGSVFKNFDQLVNLRWLFLTGILTIFLNLVVEIGTALVALAASAIQAGAALGGAFLAGLAQAAPAAGLLAAALSRFNTVLDLVKKNEQLGKKSIDPDSIRNAAQRLSDSQYSLKKAIEGVADAQYQLKQANKDVLDSYKKQRDAVKELAQAKIQAARDIVDANLEEKDAALSLAEAELGVLQAKQKLREEEEKKRGKTQDVEEARAALREAQQRLAIAKQQQDQAEISAAQQQVTIATQNLSEIQNQVDSSNTDLKDAQLGVKRAILTREQAIVRDKRARQDAEKARSEGVKGADVVKNAEQQLKDAIDAVAKAQRNVVTSNRAVRDALHQVATAQREVNDAKKDHQDAIKGESQATRDAQKAFANLSPAEKNLFRALKRIREEFKRVFVGTKNKDGILGPITDAIARAVNAIADMLDDPKIQRALRRLSGTIGDAIDKIAKFITGKNFRRDLIFFTENAANNMPKVVDALINAFQIFLNIARAATPLFNSLLDRFDKITGKARQFTSGRSGSRRPEEGAAGRLGDVATINESRLDKFFGIAGKHLDAWLKLAGAIGNIILAISGSGAAGAGKTLIERITDQLNEWSDWIRTHQDEVTKFFDRNVESISNLARTFGKVLPALVKAFSSDEFANFGRVMAELIIPGIVSMIVLLGKLSGLLLKLLDIPIIGDLLKWAIMFGVMEKSINKLFPVTQKVTEAFWKLVGAGLRAARGLLVAGGLRSALETVQLKALYARDAIVKLGRTMIDSVEAGAKRMASAVSRAKDAIISLGNQAIVAASRLGKALYGALATVARVIAVQLIAALRLLRLNIRLLLLSSGIGALILAGVLLIENWDKVKKYAKILADYLVKVFKSVVDWVKENWKKILVGILLLPFAPAGLLILGFLRFKKQILGIFGDIKDGIINRFKQAIDWIKTKVADLGNWVVKKLKGIPLVGRFFGGDDKEKPKVIQLTVEDKTKAEKIPTKRAGGGEIPGHGVLDSVPALLTPGEWVLNRAQQERLAKVLGITVAQVKATVFGTNSKLPPSSRTSRGVTRGIWNRTQTGSKEDRAPRNIIQYADFNLVSQEDPDGNTVWFLELANGSFGQVTPKDATRIQNSHGTWIPNYVKRSSAGYIQDIKGILMGSHTGFNMGGVVPMPAVQRFAAGGVVQAPGNGNTNSGNTINQNFNVKTEGSTDWGYVLRLAAINAQESF